MSDAIDDLPDAKATAEDWAIARAYGSSERDLESLAEVIARVRAQEREECAKLVDSFGMTEHIVDAIRARGTP